MEMITITTEYIKLQDLLKLAAVTATAAKCQGMEPKSTARAEKKPWASPARTEPVREPAAYRSTQPTTTE